MATPDITEIYEELTAVIENEKKTAAEEQWRKKTEDARQNRVTTLLKYMRRIGEHLPDKVKYTLDLNTGHLWIDNVDVSWNVSVDEEHSRYGGWREKPTGKIRITVGDYGSRVSYPQRKDGSHNYDRIADLLYAYAQKRNEQDRAERERQGNKSLAENLAREFGDKYGYGCFGNLQVHPSSTAEKPVLITVNFTRAMTEEDARAVYRALKDLKLVG